VNHETQTWIQTVRFSLSAESRNVICSHLCLLTGCCSCYTRCFNTDYGGARADSQVLAL